MARSILVLALCFTFAVPFVWSRRVNHDNQILSADVAEQAQDGIEHGPATSTIFVLGFKHGTDEEALKKHFGAVGAIKDLQFQGRGAAVITYKKSGAATRAVNELHETTLEGQSRALVVKLDDPDRRVNPGNKMVSADVAQQPKDSIQRSPAISTIFVNGFNYGTDEEAVKKHFGAVGAIKDLQFQGRGAAVITYKKSGAATRAVNELHETTLEGQSRYVVVKLDDPDRERKGDKTKGKDSDEGKTNRQRRGQYEGNARVPGKGGRRTIFVNGLELGTDDAALTNHFGTVGAIEDHHFQSKVSAVITYAKSSSAHRAVTELDGSVMSGQTCYVTVKLDDPDRDGAEQSGPSPSGKVAGKGPGRGIYASGFEWDVTDGSTLKKHFGKVGKVESCHFQSKGGAVVTFVKAASAQRAVSELGGTTMIGQHRYVAVKLDNPEHKAQKQLEERK